MTARFEAFMFFPDGDFSPEEVKELIDGGFKLRLEKDGVAYRMLPVEVKGIEEEKKSAFQEWNAKHIPSIQYPDEPSQRVREEIGKQYWNGALDAVLKLNTYSMELYSPGGDVPDEVIIKNNIKELKEP